MLLGLGETWQDVVLGSLLIAVPLAAVEVLLVACGLFNKDSVSRGFIRNVVLSIVTFLVLWGLLDLGRYLLSKEVNLIADINQAIMLGYMFGVYTWYASTKIEKKK